MKMKKILIALTILWSSSVSARQNGFYMSALCSKADSTFSCSVSAKFDNGRFVRYTGCTIFPYTKTPNAKIRLSFDADETPRFLDFLKKVRDKYAEWDSIAKANHVTGYSKKMPVELRSKGGIWSIFYVGDRPPRSTFDMNKQWEFLIPYFSVDANGKSRVAWSTSKLEYTVKGGNMAIGTSVEVERCSGGEFVFTSVKEIQSLIDCFDVGRLKEQSKSIDSLFQ
jgi:hypothetical protein